MNEQPTWKTLKDYQPSELTPAQVVTGSSPPPARPYEVTQGEAAGHVFDQRGSKQTDASPPPPGDIVNHPWKVEETTDDPVAWAVTGGTVWSYLTEITIADSTKVGDNGWILLKITRDTASREMTAAVVLFSATVPESDYTDEYRVIAFVNSEADKPIIQYQFEEIRIFEDLAVVNGEFRLVGLEMSHRNFYELPPP